MPPTAMTLRRRVRRFLGRQRWITPRRVVNMALVHLEMKLGRNQLWSRPYELCIDVTNKCNLGCPYCPTGRKDPNERGRGNMPLETFRDIVDELGPTVRTLDLYNWGEPFFAPELPLLIEHASRKRILTTISSNLSFRLPEERVRAIVAAGLTNLTGAIDGASQSVYETYRRGGRLDFALENLRTFVRVRREMGVEFPRLCWQFLVFKHNEHEVETARQMAAEIGVDTFAVSAGLYDDPSWAPEGNYRLDYLSLHPNRCTWLWTKAVFHWDGGLASCCMGYNKHDDFDVWRKGQFREMWNNERFAAARRIWTEPASPLPADHYCVDCDKVRFYRGLPLHSRMKQVTSLEQQAAASA